MPDCEIMYPADVPSDCFLEVARILRARTVIEEKSAFAKHVWVIQGWGQKLILGEQVLIGNACDPCESVANVQIAPATMATDDAAAETLELLAARCEAAEAADEGTIRAAELPQLPAPVVTVIRLLVKKLLDALLS